MSQASRSHHPDKSSGTVPCRNIHEIVSLSVCNLSACHLSDIAAGIAVFSDPVFFVCSRSYYFISIGIIRKKFIQLTLSIVAFKCLILELLTIWAFSSNACNPCIPCIYIHMAERTINSSILFLCIHNLHRTEWILKLDKSSKNFKISRVCCISRFCKACESAGIILPVDRTDTVNCRFLTVCSFNLTAKTVPRITAGASVFSSHHASAWYGCCCTVSNKRNKCLQR